VDLCNCQRNVTTIEEMGGHQSEIFAALYLDSGAVCERATQLVRDHSMVSGGLKRF
jgi:hypothetical protein